MLALLANAGAQVRKDSISNKQNKKIIVKHDLQKKDVLHNLTKADSTEIRKWMNKSTETPPRFAHIYLSVRSDRDFVVLRWAPSTSGGWLTANKTGYHIDRITFDKNGKPETASLLSLTPTALKPWTKDEWQKRILLTMKYAEIASQALYGEKFHPVMPGATEAAQLKAAADELMNRYSFALFCADMDPAAADGLALRLVDHNVVPGTKYVYRIFTAVQDTAYQLDTAYAVASTESFKSFSEPPGLRAEEHDKLIILRWQNPPKGNYYTAYDVYRSKDGGKSYNKLNKNPYVILIPNDAKGDFEPSYSDTSVVNYVKYIYQLKGITAFGDFSKPAEVEAMSKDMTPPPAPIVHKPVQTGRASVEINWDTAAAVADMAGYAVLRSPLPLTAYHVVWEKAPPGDIKQRSEELEKSIRQNILPANIHSYIDTNATPLEPYYTIASIDTAGNFKQSLPVYSELVDTLRPSIPTGLTGTIDTNGVVSLHWHLGPEANLIGYRILWANNLIDEFTQLTQMPVKDTSFVDTVSLKTTTRFVYYKIASVNDRYNHSLPTMALALQRPDIVPPQPPVFSKVTVSDSSVSLEWEVSSSEDVEHQALFRRISGEQSWSEAASFRKDVHTYIDTSIVKRTTYEYEIEAIDSSGLHSSMSMGVSARPYDTGVRPGVQDLETQYDEKSGSVKLLWKYPKPPKENYWFVVYRGIDNNPITEYSSVLANSTIFVDSYIDSKKKYTYAIRVMTDAGGQSALSTHAVVATQ